MLTPGPAMTRRCDAPSALAGSQLEKPAGWSLVGLSAVTVTAAAQAAGEKDWRFFPSLPAATLTITPRSTAARIESQMGSEAEPEPPRERLMTPTPRETALVAT